MWVLCALVLTGCTSRVGGEEASEAEQCVAQAPSRRPGVVYVGGTGAALGLMEALGASWDEAGARVVVEASVGSKGGLRALRDGVLDVAVVGRALSERERGWGLEVVELARTPIVFASREGGDVSVERLREVYRQDAPSWPDGSPMTTLGREPSDTALGALRAWDEGLGEALASGASVTSYTDQQMLEGLARVEGALGFVDHGALLLSGAEVEPMRLGGVAPTDGAYPVWRRLWLVRRAGAGAPAASFVEFATSQVSHGQWSARGYHAP